MTQKETKQTGVGSLLKFDPIVLVRDVAKSWTIILLFVMIASMGAYIYETTRYQPVYTTSVTYVTYSRSSSSSVYSNLTAANTVASVFEVGDSELRAYIEGFAHSYFCRRKFFLSFLFNGGYDIAENSVGHNGRIFHIFLTLLVKRGFLRLVISQRFIVRRSDEPRPLEALAVVSVPLEKLASIRRPEHY